jgi:plasmid maintenance system antidote protein VapI
VSSASKLLNDSVEAWMNLQNNPEVEKLRETIQQRQAELDTVKAEIKTVPPMEKMHKVKRSHELQ